MASHRTARHDLTCSALPDDAFQVVDFVGHEAISQPFRFEVHVVSNDPDVAFADVIDQPATLTMYRGDDPSEVNGIVSDFQQAQKRDADSDYLYTYRAVLVPRLWRLSLAFQSRIFQNLTVEEIVGRVLDEAGVDHEFSLASSYAPREYTTQYKETDLAFVQRLLEFEGVRYHIAHHDGTDTVVISDDASDAASIEAPAALAYRSQGGLVSTDGAEVVMDFVARQQLVTARTEIKDYNYRTPETELFSESEIDGEQATGLHSDSMTHVMDGGRGDALARVRNEETESARLVMSGASDCLRFRVGLRFELEDHYRASLNQPYLITAVHHEGSQILTTSVESEDPPPEYANTFTCVPASTPYRPPRRTPVPKLPGVLTARVESTGGPYAPIDDQGRYRVRFPFDLGDAGDAQATKPVRLAQPYSGPGYGQHFPVHKDAEMVVACVDGNVDRILGLATIPNPTQASPVTADNQTENTVKTAADNHIVLQDKSGMVGIDISTPTASSRIHMGAAEDAVQGIQSSTSATQTIHAGEGVFIKTGAAAETASAVLAASDLSELGANMTMVDGAVGVALAALGIGSLSSTAAKMGAVNAAVGAAAGLAYPGVYVISEGGVMMGTPAGISGYAGAGGVSFASATGIDLAAATLGINLAAGAGGINLGVGVGDIHAATGKGDVTIETKIGDMKIQTLTGQIMTEAKKVVQVTSHTGNIQFQAPDANGSFTVYAGKNVELEAKKDITLDAAEGVLKVKTKDKATLDIGEAISIQSKGSQIQIKCGKAKLTLKKNGDILINGKKITLKGSGDVKIKGSKTGIN